MDEKNLHQDKLQNMNAPDVLQKENLRKRFGVH